MNSRYSLRFVAAAAVLCTGAFWLGRHAAVNGRTTSDPDATRGAAATADSASGNASETETFDQLFLELRSIVARGYWVLDAAWQDRLDHLDSTQLQRLADFVLATPPSDARGEMRRAIYSSWARVAPLNAIVHAQQITAVNIRPGVLNRIMESWAFQDVSELLTWTMTQAPGEASHAAVRALFAQVGDLPPATLFQLAVDSGYFASGDTGMQQLFESWVHKDPLAAAAAVERFIPAASQFSARAQLVLAWAAVNPEAALNWIESLPANQSQNLIGSAFQAWAQTDPRSAATRATQLGSALQRNQALGSIFSIWMRNDNEDALQWLTNQPPYSNPPNMLSDALSRFSAREPDKAISIIRSLTPEQQSTLRLGALAFTLGDTRPEAFVQLLLEMPISNTRSEAARILLERVAIQDPDHALELTRIQGLIDGNPGLMGQIIGKIAKSDPELALNEVLQLPTALARNEALEQIVKALTSDDPTLAGVFADAIPPGAARESAFRSIASSLSEVGDGTAAMTWVEGIADPSSRRAAADSAAQSWIQLNTPAAIAWFNQTTNTELKLLALEGFAKHWPNVDVAGFVQAVLTENDPAIRASMLTPSTGRNLAFRSPQLAMNLVEGLPPGDLRDQTLASVVTQLVQTAPREAIDLAQSLPAGPMKTNAICQVLNTWAYHSPEVALQWLQDQPATTVPPDYYGQLAGAWHRREATQSSAWIQSLPTGTNRDAAIRNVAQSVGLSGDFEQIAPLIPMIGNETTRSETMVRFTQSWLRTAPRTATAWVNGLPLTPAQKNALLAGLPPGP